MMNNSDLEKSIKLWLAEDIGNGDHSSLACIPPEAKGKAMLLVKEEGIIAGLRVAAVLFETVDK
ncbi:MAG TPA: hypothetical protein VK155_08985, partial [Bacteroidales bacterium]|nr:hypothetical protein [Bacteroidales bacterium]